MTGDDFHDTPADPIADAAATAGDNPGPALLLEARELIARGEFAAAADRCRQAHRSGLPADLVPHYHVLCGAALLGAGDAVRASDVLADGWRTHPDFAALPALLGLARYAIGHHHDAARAFFAALAGDDPDASLSRYRTALATLPGPLARE